MASKDHRCVIIGLFGPGSRTVVTISETEIAHTLAVAEHERKQREKLANKTLLGTKKVLTQ